MWDCLTFWASPGPHQPPLPVWAETTLTSMLLLARARYLVLPSPQLSRGFKTCKPYKALCSL
eukprot:1151676-Pelagomonas_calceolata.AAC.11